jgi:Tfp pilus assembly protein PilF
MRRFGWVTGIVLVLGGCTTTSQDRLREYSQDGVHLFRRGDYTSARQCFQAALELEPDDPDLHYNLGQCYDRQGLVEQAERRYTECVQRAPNHAEGRHALAALLLRTGRTAEAVTLVEGWLAREPNLAAAYAEDGWVRRQRGDLPGAKDRFHQALQRDPHNRRALLELALVFEALDHPDRARDLYEKVLAQDPQQPEVVQRYNLLLTKNVGRPKPE